MQLKTNEPLTKNTYKNLVKNLEKYKIRRNMSKTIVIKTLEESWDRFICRTEADIFGEQSMAYNATKTPQPNKREHNRN